MNFAYRCCIALITLGLSLPAFATVSAQLDHDQIGPGETVQLMLQHDGQTDSQPDLRPLEQDFEVLGRSSGSNIQIINGKMDAKVQISLMLMPKHDGKLLIPALQWDGEATAPLTLVVSNNPATTGNAAAGNAAQSKDSHVFLTVTPDQNQPYVQAAVTVMVRIYTDQPLYQASLVLQPGKDVLVQQLGQDKQSNEIRNGKNYQVVERKYLLFPQRSGQVQLDGAVLDAQIQDDNSNDPFGNNRMFGNIFGNNPFAGMLNATKTIRIHSAPVSLNVRPRPAGSTGHEWLPAHKVTLEASWQPDSGSVHAGDPVTLHLHLSAEGSVAAQLPDLSQKLQLSEGLRAYPDQAKLNDAASGNSVIGTRDQDVAIIANQAGHYVIPALHLSWWDVTKNLQQEIVLPAHTLEVLPSAGGVAVATTPPAEQQKLSTSTAIDAAVTPQQIEMTTSYRWRWGALVFASLWLLTLAAWWRSNRIRSHLPEEAAHTAEPVISTPRVSAARSAFRQACQHNDAQAARRHLLEWAGALWPQEKLAGLHALAFKLDEDSVRALLKQLDRACYTASPWQGEALMEALQNLQAKRIASQPVSRLAGIYP